jgi:hypothetical protein
MRTQRHATGCVRFDKRRGTWNYLFYDHGKRRSKRIGTKKDYPTKAAAWKAVGPVYTMPQQGNGETVRDVSTRYQSRANAYAALHRACVSLIPEQSRSTEMG